MSESTIQRLRLLDIVELELLHEVERTGAEYRASFNGNREAAARGFERALRTFNNLILRNEMPEKRRSASA